MKELVTFTYPRKARVAATVFDRIAGTNGARFFGVENVTAKGVRKWSIAPRPPKSAIAALVGGPRAPDPAHIRRVWDGGKHAWRSLDLNTCRVIWYTRYGITIRYVFA